MRVVETAGAVGRKGHHMPLAERVVQWQCHIVGQALRPHVAKDGVLAAKQGIAFEILADLGGAFMDLIGGTVDVFGSAPDIVVDLLSQPHASNPTTSFGHQATADGGS